jgi:hypothetical protein
VTAHEQYSAMLTELSPVRAARSISVRHPHTCQRSAYHVIMTTRDDLHRMVDHIDRDHLDAAAAALEPYAEQQQPPLPASLGLGHSGRGDLSERVDELLAESGFGQ